MSRAACKHFQKFWTFTVPHHHRLTSANHYRVPHYSRNFYVPCRGGYFPFPAQDNSPWSTWRVVDTKNHIGRGCVRAIDPIVVEHRPGLLHHVVVVICTSLLQTGQRQHWRLGQLFRPETNTHKVASVEFRASRVPATLHISSVPNIGIILHV